MRRASLLCVVCVSLGLVHTVMGSWSVQVLAKRPFLSEHYDTTGQVSYDSLARHYPLRVTIFRNESESLFQSDTTGDSGFAAFTFSYWAEEKRDTSMKSPLSSSKFDSPPESVRSVPV